MKTNLLTHILEITKTVGKSELQINKFIILNISFFFFSYFINFDCIKNYIISKKFINLSNLI